MVVELVRSLGRNLIDVGDVHDCAGERDVAGHARLEERQRLRLETATRLALAVASRQDIVLHRREAQTVALTDVHRAGLGARQPTRFGEEQLEGALTVGLRRERIADSREGFSVKVHAPPRGARLPPARV